MRYRGVAVSWVITEVIYPFPSSAPASAVLIGGYIHLIGASTAAFTMLCATLVGLAENVTIFYLLTRNRAISVRVILLLSPVALLGVSALVLVSRR